MRRAGYSTLRSRSTGSVRRPFPDGPEYKNLPSIIYSLTISQSSFICCSERYLQSLAASSHSSGPAWRFNFAGPGTGTVSSTMLTLGCVGGDQECGVRGSSFPSLLLWFGRRATVSSADKRNERVLGYGTLGRHKVQHRKCGWRCCMRRRYASLAAFVRRRQHQTLRPPASRAWILALCVLSGRV